MKYLVVQNLIVYDFFFFFRANNSSFSKLKITSSILPLLTFVKNILEINLTNVETKK